MAGYTLSEVLGFNTKLSDVKFGPGLVGLFVGGTSGIGETTVKAFARHAISPRIYVVGRSQESYDRIANEVKALNADAKLTFLPADCSEIREVDRVCNEVIKIEEGIQAKGKGGAEVNLLMLTVGFMSVLGRNESPEGLDRKMACHYYSRLRFINNFQPLLDTASASNKPARVVSVLAAGHHESDIDFNDLGLKKNFSVSNCAKHSSVMTTLSFEELAKKNPGTAYVHTSPGIVKSGYLRSYDTWYMKPFIGALNILIKPWETGFEECGERHLFVGLSGMEKWVARKDRELFKKCEVGTNGERGSGAYTVGPNNQIVGNGAYFAKLRSEGAGKKVMEHTLGVFKEVEKLNATR
ncbi:hypothetical protein B7463_g8134, partial [Scytalidium lignicola]